MSAILQNKTDSQRLYMVIYLYKLYFKRHTGNRISIRDVRLNEAFPERARLKYNNVWFKMSAQRNINDEFLVRFNLKIRAYLRNDSLRIFQK